MPRGTGRQLPIHIVRLPGPILGTISKGKGNLSWDSQFRQTFDVVPRLVATKFWFNGCGLLRSCLNVIKGFYLQRDPFSSLKAGFWIFWIFKDWPQLMKVTQGSN